MSTSKLIRKALSLTGITLLSVSGSILWMSPSRAGNELQIEAIANVIPACDILGQSVGELVESVSGDATDGFTRGVVASLPVIAPATLPTGTLAYVALSCTAGDSTIATVTSPVQTTGTDLDIFTATTRMYAPTVATLANTFDTVTPADLVTNFTDALPVASVVGDETVRTSDAATILGTTSSAVAATSSVFGIGFEVMVSGERVPSGQFGFATTLSVVPR